MEEKKIKRKEWVKTATIIFLLIMLVLTFFSNTIMNYSLPEVATEYVQSDSITMQVRGTGMVEAGDPYNVIIEENRTIKSVVVKNGDVVEKGQTLFYLEDSKSADTKALEDQIEQAEIAYKQALLGENVSSTVYNNIKKGVTTDTAAYQKNIQAQKTNIAEIEKVISDLKTQRSTAEATLIQIGGSGVDLNTATTNAAAAKTARDAAKANYDSCQQALDSYTGTDEAEIRRLEDALAAAKTTLDAREYDVYIANSTVALIKQIELCDANLVTANNNLLIGQEALKKLQSDVQVELDLVAQKKQLDDLKEQLQEMRDKTAGGKIVAPVTGTVTGIAHVAGETIMAGETVAVMQAEGKGHTLSFSVTKKQAATLSVGDKGEVSNSWYYSDVVATLLSIKPDPADPTNNKKLTFNLEGDVTAGQSLTLAVGQRSANYDYTVPNNAIREDKDGKFVLVLEQKPSPLGSRYYAVRRNVEVLASDDHRSAINGEIYAYEYVVTTSTKPIQEGQQVRLIDN